MSADQPRFVAKEVTPGQFRVYDTAKACYPVLLGGHRVRQDLTTREDAEAEAQRVSGWRR